MVIDFHFNISQGPSRVQEENVTRLRSLYSVRQVNKMYPSAAAPRFATRKFNLAHRSTYHQYLGILNAISHASWLQIFHWIALIDLEDGIPITYHGATFLIGSYRDSIVRPTSSNNRTESEFRSTNDSYYEVIRGALNDGLRYFPPSFQVCHPF